MSLDSTIGLDKKLTVNKFGAKKITNMKSRQKILDTENLY